MMKRKLFIIAGALAIGLSLTVLAGCGSSGARVASGTDSTASSRANTVSIRNVPKAKDCLAKGAAAEKQEQYGIALYWYYSAAWYDESLTEATQKSAALEEKINGDNPWGITGNNRLSINAEIEKRWTPLVMETMEFLNMPDNNPFLTDDELLVKVKGVDELGRPRVDSNAGTVNYTVDANAGTVNYTVAIYGEVVEKKSFNPAVCLTWEFVYSCVTNGKFIKSNNGVPPSIAHWSYYFVQAELLNGNGEVIAISLKPNDRIPTSVDRGFTQADFYTDGSQSYHFSNEPYGLRVHNDKMLISGNLDIPFYNVPLAKVTDTGMRARIIKVFQYDGSGNLFKVREIK